MGAHLRATYSIAEVPTGPSAAHSSPERTSSKMMQLSQNIVPPVCARARTRRDPGRPERQRGRQGCSRAKPKGSTKTVRLVVNAETAEIVQSLDHDAFGVVLSDSNPGFQPFGFPGGISDWDFKLVRFGARDYDPAIGRWTAKDLIGFAGEQMNVYVYVGNDPVNFVDPTGKWGLSLSNSAEAAYCLFGCAPSVGVGQGFYIGTEGFGTFAFAKAGLGVGAHASAGPSLGLYNNPAAFDGFALGGEVDAALVLKAGGTFSRLDGNWHASLDGGFGGGLWTGAFVSYSVAAHTTWGDLADTVWRDLGEWAQLYAADYRK